jgi:hypothetical protein
MKCLKPVVLGTVIATVAAIGSVRAQNLPAGQVDFGSFSPPHSGGQFIEVNLTSSLISLATRLFEKDQPEVAQLLSGLQMVRVNVVGLDDGNRGELEKRTQTLRRELDGKGWERIVVARQENQDVGIYLKTKNKDTVQGLVVTVIDGSKQAVFINIVGNIKPDQLALLGERLHIDPLKNLGHMTGKGSERAEKQGENKDE